MSIAVEKPRRPLLLTAVVVSVAALGFGAGLAGAADPGHGAAP